jgi:8-amino-7-oxononanoate synthase
MQDAPDPLRPLRAAAAAREAAGLRRVLRPRCPFIFDTGLARPCAGAALAALDTLAAEPGLGERTRANALRIARIAAGLGLDVSRPAAGVISVTLGSPAAATAAQRACAEHGVRAGCFRPPSVPAGRACLRLAARATLAERDFTAAARALAAVAGQTQPPAPADQAPTPAGRRSS